MARLEIIEVPDPRLRLSAQPIEEFDDALARFADDLLETLHGTSGIGLSAPQVGDRRNVLVMDLSEDRTEPQVYVNPKIHAKAAWGLVEESCLSVPGVVGKVVRATKVAASAQDVRGNVFERELTGMHAVCLQHEIDHLEGTLFTDRLPFFEKLRLRFFSRGRAAAPST